MASEPEVLALEQSIWCQMSSNARPMYVDPLNSWRCEEWHRIAVVVLHTNALHQDRKEEDQLTEDIQWLHLSREALPLPQD
jgi:hypothetical protein